MRVVFEFMLFEAGAFFGFFVAALLNAARAGQELHRDSIRSRSRSITT